MQEDKATRRGKAEVGELQFKQGWGEGGAGRGWGAFGRVLSGKVPSDMNSKEYSRHQLKL